MRESSDNNNTNTTAAAKKGRDGVADYFAILGVGEKLVWKHAQKSSVGEYSASKETDEEEEDEAAMLERFYREIVEIAIVTKPASTALSYADNYGDMSRRIPLTASFATDDSASISSSQANNATVTSTTRFSQIVTSPSHSDATTAYQTLADSSLHTTTILDGRNELFDGFTIIRQTCPAGRGSTTTPAATAPSTSSNADDSMRSITSESDCTWKKFQSFDANLDPITGLRAELSSLTSNSSSLDNTLTNNNDVSLKGLRRKVGSTLRNQLLGLGRRRDRKANISHQGGGCKFYMAYRRRAPDETYRPAIADVSLQYIRLHKSTVCSSRSSFSLDHQLDEMTKLKHHHQQQQRSSKKQGSSMASRSKYSTRYESFHGGAPEPWLRENSMVMPLADIVPIPSGYDSWVLPEDFRYVKQPDLQFELKERRPMTYIVPHRGPEFADDATASSTGTSGIGVEAFVDGNSLFRVSSPTAAGTDSSVLIRENGLSPRISEISDVHHHEPTKWDREVYRPRLWAESLPVASDIDALGDYIFIPAIAIRRQRVGDEERYHEDPGVADIAVMFSDQDGNVVLPSDDPDHNTDGEDDDDTFSLLSKTPWVAESITNRKKKKKSQPQLKHLRKGSPIILVRRNIPVGFADAAFATRVLDRFPFRNFKGLPLPAEELPMFCYPTGCRLNRARFSDAPLPQYYG